MKKLGHWLFFSLTVLWLMLILFYQVLVNSRYERVTFKQAFSSLSQLKHQLPDKGEPLKLDASQIAVVCQPLCQFIVEDQVIRSRKDSDAAGGVEALTLHFFDSQKGLIGYQDHESHPSFYVIDKQSNLLQVIRLKLDHLQFSYQAYYPQTKQILFRSDQGEDFLYAADQPSLQLL